ncbi:MAG: HAMP domain-containing histidine kinase [Ruminococcus sp.]|nr:HAMP domain-containing histidine kinase [Ruminococcus sp.]
MSVVDYLKDKALLLFLHIGCMSVLTVFLRLTGYSLDGCVVILFCWCLVLGIWLLWHFLNRRSYFQKLEQIVEKLDQRYLLGELMPTSFHLEDRLYRTLIRKSNKSVIERIRRLEEAQKEYREYIESWVHEIKAPITGIALDFENHRDERSRYFLAENRKIENYVDMALYYARSEEVYQDYLIAETNLQEAAEEVLMKNKQYLIQCGIRAEVSCPDPVFTDKKWVQFILNQLLLNSAKYRREEGAFLRIATESTGWSILLKVQDNGIGIPAEDLPRIFEKGFTGTNGRRPGERSTGIGLYLCRKLCRKLGIEIRAASVEGEGTEMRLEFPVSSYLAGYRE